MGNNPSSLIGYSFPNENVTYYDCPALIAKPYIISKEKYRLPTDEWEFVAQCNNKSNGHKYDGNNSLYEVTWCMSSRYQTHNVCEKHSNELGLKTCAEMFSDGIRLFKQGIIQRKATTRFNQSKVTECYVLRGGSFAGEASKSRITCSVHASQNKGLNSS